MSTTVELAIIVPDYFPDEWNEAQPSDDETGTLILIESRNSRLRGDVETSLEIVFTMPGGFPRWPWERRATRIEHTFERDIRPTLALVDGPGPWARCSLGPSILDRSTFLKGDTLILDLNLAVTA